MSAPRASSARVNDRPIRPKPLIPTRTVISPPCPGAVARSQRAHRPGTLDDSIGGLDFFVDTWTRNVDEKSKPGSDGEHVRELIRKAGYQLPKETMSARLVHLLDEEKRKELMIIYSEDLQPMGHTAADLKKGGKAYDDWAGIEEGLIQRAKSAIRITQ